METEKRLHVKSLAELTREIKAELQKGKEQAYHIYEREKVITNWRIGKLLDEFLAREEGVHYGKNLFSQLSDRLKIGIQTLYRCKKFYKLYAKNLNPETTLNWSHYRLLIRVKDNSKRQQYEKAVYKNKLSSTELQELIRQEKNSKESGIYKKKKLPSRLLGKLYTYLLKYIPVEDQTYLDCGFKIYRQLPANLKKNYQPGYILLSIEHHFI